MLNLFSTIFVTLLSSLIASSGFWLFLQNQSKKQDAKTRLLLRMCHDRIMYLGMTYIEKGTITQEEFINLHDWLYIPYVEIGGNGGTHRVMFEVKKLPIKSK